MFFTDNIGKPFKQTMQTLMRQHFFLQLISFDTVYLCPIYRTIGLAKMDRNIKTIFFFIILHFKVFCGAGEQARPSEDSCEPCPVGKIKPSASHDQCADCPTDRASNDERTACSVCKFYFLLWVYLFHSEHSV